MLLTSEMHCLLLLVVAGVHVTDNKTCIAFSMESHAACATNMADVPGLHIRHVCIVVHGHPHFNI
jgi:hypothetical protein